VRRRLKTESWGPAPPIVEKRMKNLKRTLEWNGIKTTRRKW
jgi:hypothetical protein